MPEKWTGDLIGRMHNANITKENLAKEIGCSKAYISMILNGNRTPKGGRERLETAFDKIKRERNEVKKGHGEKCD